MTWMIRTFALLLIFAPAWFAPAWAAPAARPASSAARPASSAASFSSVIDFGAVGDGETDCTAAFQQALDAAAKAGGGIVTVPAGTFRIDGTLTIPPAVTLQGTFRAAPTDFRERGFEPAGSVLYAYAGRNAPDSKPFISMSGSNPAIAGLIITYPEWKQTTVPPAPYPPTVLIGRGDNAAVIDCCFMNSYEAIRCAGAARFLIRNVNGYPSWRGLYVDACYDIGRVENVHYWPFGVIYKPDEPYCEWVNNNGVAFEFARTDWQYVVNTFCFGYGVGYKFSQSPAGACNGNFLGIGADCCRRAILVEAVQLSGLLITNAELVGRWNSQDSVCVEIAKSAGEGKLSLNNCSFWGPIDRCVWARSAETQFTAIGTHFANWDVNGNSAPAIQLDAGKAIIQGNTFGQGDIDVQVAPRVRSAIIMGNQAEDGLSVLNEAGQRAQVMANEVYISPVSGADMLHYRIDIGTHGDRPFIARAFQAGQMPQPGSNDPTMRWTSGDTLLKLPVMPGKAYTLTLDVHLPGHAVDASNGIYLGGKRLAGLPGQAYAGPVTVEVPPCEQEQIELSLRVRQWVPMHVQDNSRDARRLGLALYAMEMKAAHAPTTQPAVINPAD